MSECELFDVTIERRGDVSLHVRVVNRATQQIMGDWFVSADFPELAIKVTPRGIQVEHGSMTLPIK